MVPNNSEFSSHNDALRVYYGYILQNNDKFSEKFIK